MVHQAFPPDIPAGCTDNRNRDDYPLKDVEPWQQDFWTKIIEADLRGKPDAPEFHKLENFGEESEISYQQLSKILSGKVRALHGKTKAKIMNAIFRAKLTVK